MNGRGQFTFFIVDIIILILIVIIIMVVVIYYPIIIYVIMLIIIIPIVMGIVISIGVMIEGTDSLFLFPLLGFRRSEQSEFAEHFVFGGVLGICYSCCCSC